MDLRDVLNMPSKQPKRKPGRPPDGETERERKSLAAWLVEDGILTAGKVSLLAGVSRRTVFRWKALNRKSA